LKQIKSGLLSYLGAASYSIYLVQMLTIPAIFKFSSNLLVGWGGDILALVCLGLSVAFGCFVYSAFEKPVSVGLKNISTVRTWLPRYAFLKVVVCSVFQTVPGD
jgi:peptidoglycan/LPS O-acetylase OafA/YrhL